MNIYIKSFNRPLYLDRCIQSIKIMARNYDSIIILDDGTNRKFVEKIQKRYPEVIFRFSPDSDMKSEYVQKILLGEDENLYNIGVPSKFWHEEIKKDCQQNFVLLEDDLWLVRPIDFSRIEKNMLANNVLMLKLSWNGSKEFSGEKHVDTEVILDETETIQFYNPIIRTGEHFMKLLQLFQVCSAIYCKEYWLNNLEGLQKWDDERSQMYKALDFCKKELAEGRKIRFAKTKYEILKHGFSTTVSVRPDFIKTKFNVFLYNDALNDAWYENSLDPMQGYPYDFSEERLSNIFRSNSIDDYDIKRWQEWKMAFINQYRSIGCEI